MSTEKNDEVTVVAVGQVRVGELRAGGSFTNCHFAGEFKIQPVNPDDEVVMHNARIDISEADVGERMRKHDPGSLGERLTMIDKYDDQIAAYGGAPTRMVYVEIDMKEKLADVAITPDQARRLAVRLLRLADACEESE